MDEITEESLQKAEDAIAAKVIGNYPANTEILALDYTNYYTYISSGNCRCKIAKRGKNKQKRNDLRQCSLAVVTAKDLGIPLFSHVYEGNRNDQTEFGEYIPLLKKRMPGFAPPKTTLVFDGGSNTKENLERLDMHYLCSFSLSYCKELYDIPADTYEVVVLEKGAKVAAYRTQKIIWGKERTCVLSLSDALYAGQERELKENIRKTLDDLEKLDEQIRNPKSRIPKTAESLLKRAEKLLKRKYMKEIIQFQVSNAGITYEVDAEKETAIKEKYFGKKLLITDRGDWSTEEILGVYREQDCIEKIFRDSKDTSHCSLQPIFHWTDQKIRVHIFICLLGLTMSAVLQKEAEKRGLHLSNDRLLEELGGIRESWITEGNDATGKVLQKLEKMNDVQEKLWAIIEEL